MCSIVRTEKPKSYKLLFNEIFFSEIKEEMADATTF